MNSETPTPDDQKDTPSVSPSSPIQTNQDSTPSHQTVSNDSQADATDEAQDNRGEGIRGILSTIAILIIAPLIALSLTAFVFQSYEVDGPSMETTLQNHDRLIVYKLPKTIARITRKPYIPNRGDIVVFKREESFAFGGNTSRQLIKRVVALPGERVVVKNNVLTVYNQSNPNGFKPDDADYGKVIKTTPGDVELIVPEGQVFVCGDNRTNSLDSRAFGPIDANDLTGKLILRVYPFGKGKTF